MKFSGLRIGLRLKALFGLVIPVSILFIVLMLANESYLTNKIKSNYVDDVGLIIDVSVTTLKQRTTAEIKSESNSMLAPLRQAGPFVDQANVFIADADRHLRSTETGRRAIEPDMLDLRAFRSGKSDRRLMDNGRLELAVPVVFKDGAKGVLAVTVNLDQRDELITSLRVRSIWIVALGLLVLSGIILIGVEKTFLRPLNGLRQATMIVKKDGEFEPPPISSRRDELGDLAGSINEMADHLDRHARALERRLSELTVLYNISKVASSSLNLDKTLNIILESAVKVTEATSGFIMLDKQDGEAVNLELKASLGLAVNAAEKGIISWDTAEYVAENGGPLLLVGELKDAIYAPINLANRTIGVIGLVNKQNGNFRKKDLQLVLTLGNQAAGVINAARLFADLQESYFSTIQALAAAIDAKDPYTRGHSSRVAGYSEMISVHLGCSAEEQKAIRIAAYLHDIGKIGIEERILLKPDGLTSEEYRTIREHPNISARILSSVAFLKDTVPMVAHHHECFNGTGYPDGLAGTDIPLGARVITVADSFDAMTSDRPYRKALSQQQALSELAGQAGSQFDPEIVKILVENIKEVSTITDELVAPG